MDLQRIVCLELALTVDTSAYATGDSLCSGALALPDAVPASSNSGIIRAVELASDTVLTVGVDFIGYSSNPSGSTFTANGAHALVKADQFKALPPIHLSDITDVGGGSINAAHGLAVPIVLTASTTLYCSLVIRGAATLVATDCSLRVYIQQ